MMAILTKKKFELQQFPNNERERRTLAFSGIHQVQVVDLPAERCNTIKYVPENHLLKHYSAKQELTQIRSLY